MILEIIEETPKARFGRLNIQGFKCFTIENKEKCIPKGTYHVRPCIHHPLKEALPTVDILVEGRTHIHIHYGSFPHNYEGCIGVGDSYNNKTEMLFNTKDTFNKIKGLLQQETEITIR